MKKTKKPDLRWTDKIRFVSDFTSSTSEGENIVYTASVPTKKPLNKRLEDALDIKGGAVVGALSLIMLVYVPFCIFRGHDIPTGVGAMWTIITGFYGAHRTIMKTSRMSKNEGGE